MIKIGDIVTVVDGELKGIVDVVTELTNDPANSVCLLNNQYWVETANCKPYTGKDITKIKYFTSGVNIEQHGDWVDLKAAKDMQYTPGAFMMIPLGVAMELPSGYEAHLLPRSSTFKNYGIIMTNSMGIIDEAYCGDDDQWHFPAYSLRSGEIKKGDRIAQFRIVKKQSPLRYVQVDRLDNDNRGGFGSSGK